MFPAFLTVILFAISASFATKPSRALGGVEANFWRLILASFFLFFWWAFFDNKASTAGFKLFLLSGVVGYGLGDLALYESFPRLGARLSMLMIHCFGAPIGALIEWFWLGTPMTPTQIAFAMIILAGVALALAPDHGMNVSRKTFWTGVILGFCAALGQCFGAVLSRKASLAVIATGASINGLTAGAQRVSSGLVIATTALVIYKIKQSRNNPKRDKNFIPDKSLWLWIFLNGSLGPFLGTGTYQWALANYGTGVVLPIVALTPLAVIPFAYFIENERPRTRSICGSLLAVIGAVGLAWVTHQK